ncbi:MAG: hypothetical protein Q7S50_00935 [bacterium]|nr:hypothetical protein [bacterium]
MFGTHLGRGRGKIVAVADIGSGSAAVAILALHPRAPATVLAATRAILPIEERTQEALIAGIGEQLVKAAGEAQKQYAAMNPKGVKPVRALYCIIRAPWSRSQTALSGTAFKEETTITEQMVSGLAQQAIATVKELDPQNFFETSVTRVELNGYPTGEPIGKRAREIRISTLVSDCNPRIRAEVESSLQSVFPHLSPVFRSSTRALVSVLRELPQRERDYFIVDMASEGTSLIAVRDGVPAEHISISEGVRTILNRISDTGLPEETLSLIRMLAREECSTTACETIQRSLGLLEPELVRVFGEAMSTCAKEMRLPNALLLIAHPDVSPWLSKFFSRIDFAQFTMTTQPFIVGTIDIPDLAHLVKPHNGVARDSALALGCALVNMEENRA